MGALVDPNILTIMCGSQAGRDSAEQIVKKKFQWVETNVARRCREKELFVSGCLRADVRDRTRSERKITQIPERKNRSQMRARELFLRELISKKL